MVVKGKRTSFHLERGSTLRKKGDGGEIQVLNLPLFTLTRSQSSDLSPQGRGEENIYYCHPGKSVAQVMFIAEDLLHSFIRDPVNTVPR